ncbi:MAG: protein kinase [Acidobacteriota bacterium]|nr:MAG: protein kinase [Acidobacteriota bacterium]
MIGQTIGHYEITAKLGQGGMGEVYRARDTRLNRDVALKVLPEMFSGDEQRMGRLSREAQVLASLNHPNIASIHGLEESKGQRVLVMELVEGEDLSERIARGPIPLDEALPMAIQIAEALEDAHEKGIVHRDLKPANIKLTPEGKVKVLDFGLAKALEDPVTGSPSGAGLSQSPTLSMAATQAGIILGTAAYMAPEQARGKIVDKRTDIWAFGVVLFEMLSGKQTFEGEDLSMVMASVMMKEPAWDALPESLPRIVRTLLKRCLEKDPGKRLRDIGEARILIDNYLANPIPADTVGLGVEEKPAPRRREVLPWALFALTGVLLFAALWFLWSQPAGPSQVRRLGIDWGADVVLDTGSRGVGAVFSPDGRAIAFIGRASAGDAWHLYLRDLDRLQAVALPGTEEAIQPSFSPDGQWIVFKSGRYLKKISVTGGAPVTLCETGNSRGINWGEDGSIVFSPGARTGLYQVPGIGGMPQPITQLAEREETHRWPQMLPGGDTVLFTSHTDVSDFDSAQIVVQSLPDGERKVLWQGGYFGRYVPSGHLVFVREGTVFAATFDLNRLEMTGEPRPVLEGLLSVPGFGLAQLSISKTGQLIYLTGNESEQALVWVDRNGVEEPLTDRPGKYDQPRLSPDGRLLAMEITGDIWVYDLERATSTRVTYDGGNRPAWTPDGKKIVFTHSSGLSIAPIDGSSQAEQLTESELHHSNAVSPDGRTVLLHSHEAGTDILTLDFESRGEPVPWLASEFSEDGPSFSPDGKWIVFVSSESGGPEIYVRPFPGPGGRTKVSTDGGDQPLWKPNGEIFYKENNRMMAVRIRTEPELVIGRPQLLFEGDYLYGNAGPFASFDVTPDGRRFVMLKETLQSRSDQQQLVLVENWSEELKAPDTALR